MAEPKPPAVEAASVPDPTLVSRAEAFTRERFVHEGEDTAVALAPGSARRRALDAALAEIERGEKVPSTKWRRRYALLLGLERVLSEEEPRLADGPQPNPQHAHPPTARSSTRTRSTRCRARWSRCWPRRRRASTAPPPRTTPPRPCWPSTTR